MGKILVVGSLHFDIMLDADHRPEKGETVISNNMSTKFGGKGGNQAISAALSGSDVSFMGAIGDDENGRYLISTLLDHNIDTTYVDTIDSAKSGMSVAISDAEGDYGAVVASNANKLINPEKLILDEPWQNVSMLILQGEVPDTINIKVASEAHKRGIKVCMNLAPVTNPNTEVLSYVDLLVVNGVEARDLCGISVDSLECAKKAVAKLLEISPEVVVTAGEFGVAFGDQSQGVKSIPAIKVKLISTHGAGDCFMGMLCTKLNKGETLGKSALFANIRASEHVSEIRN